MTQQTLGISQYLFLLTIVLGGASTVLTGVVAHMHAPAQVKSIILLIFSLGSGAIEQVVQTHGSFTWHGFLTATAIAFTAGVVAHKGALLAFITGPDGLIAQYIPGGIGAGLVGMPGTATVATSPATTSPVPIMVPPASSAAAVSALNGRAVQKDVPPETTA